MDRLERFYKIDALLQERTVVPRDDFLRELEVSLATFKRDLEYMRDRFRAPVVWDADLRGYSMEYTYLGDKNNALVRGMLAAIRAQSDQPGFVLKGGTSDMNVVGVTWTCPIIAYGPGDSNLDHTPDEHISLDEYARAVGTLRHLIEHLE